MKTFIFFQKEKRLIVLEERNFPKKGGVPIPIGPYFGSMGKIIVELSNLIALTIIKARERNFYVNFDAIK